MNPRVSIHTLGCKVNAYDSAALTEKLRDAGCTIVGHGDPSDVVIVNSCTVTDTADAESRQLARRARRTNPDARVILTGCYAQTSPADAEAEPAIDVVIGTSQPDAIVRAVTAPTTVGRQVGNVRRMADVPTLGARTFGGHTRAFLKVQEGCDLFCTFCIVPMARGRSRSVPPRVVLSEIAALARRGFEEVVLTGIHLGGYGHDLAPAVDLLWLLDALAEQSLIPRIRLSSIDPHEVTEPLVRRVASIPALCPHFHVPLQSGDDRVLRRMRRRYDAALAHERFAMIRDLLPDAAIGTDVIAGFPGETAAEFDRTGEFLASSPLTYAHVFPYSVRTGTTAAKFDEQVPPGEIKRRAQVLREAGERKREAFASAHAGTQREVLLEHGRDREHASLRGYSDNYIRLRVEGPDEWMGSRRLVRLEMRTGVPWGHAVT